MRTAIVFPGQGSQYVGMGLDLFQNSDYAKGMFQKADEILGYQISDICFNGPLETLKETRYTQPALFVHSALLFDLIKNKVDPIATAGHSVGEYAALYAAEVLSYEEGLKLVSLRGQLMFQSGVEKPGTMFAIIGLADEKVEEICREITENGNGNIVVPANYNSPGQLVVSGSRDLLRNSADKFKSAGARMVKELVVSGAFHSPLLESSSEKLTEAINSTNFRDAKFPVYLNVTAQPETNAQVIKQALIAQLTSPVKWSQIMANMHQNGIKSFVEVGAGNVLQGLLKRTLSEIEINGIDTYESYQNFIK